VSWRRRRRQSPSLGTRDDSAPYPPIPLPVPRPAPARLAASGEAPQGAMLLHHLGARHPTEIGPYLERMRTEDIATAAAEAFEVVEEDETR
jgi:hypothetical protein